MKEIPLVAAEIGAKYIKRIGKPDKKAKLVAYQKETALPENVEIYGFQYEVRKFIPPLMRCNKFQQYGHSEAVCRNEVL